MAQSLDITRNIEIDIDVTVYSVHLESGDSVDFELDTDGDGDLIIEITEQLYTEYTFKEAVEAEQAALVEAQARIDKLELTCRELDDKLNRAQQDVHLLRLRGNSLVDELVVARSKELTAHNIRVKLSNIFKEIKKRFRV